ncbi:hypothetical protein HPB50_011332 [Hyalomma asiaticum]|uniref:Uncharacterized protein n=1 Tax=Hyalomma asiaticum TaxID=266040 RepID=A0ACB7RIY5_HYAAI|nr:hypothetical protein HPB50_011332 [Hyalomma asiaticum]
MLKYGADLTYKNTLSVEDAHLLRRMLSTGPRVRKLHLHRTMYEAFRVAFHHRGECDSLKEVHFGLVDCSGKDLGISRCCLFRRLRSLHLRCVHTGSAFAEDIASYIQQNKLLRELDLSVSCGGVQGVATLIATLTENDTLKKFSLADVFLPSDTVISFANLLTCNDTLELVDLTEACRVGKNQLRPLLRQELYSGVFRRLKIVWPVQLISEVTVLLQEGRCCPQLWVSLADGAPVDDLRKFFTAAFDKMLCELHLECTDAVYLTIEPHIMFMFETSTTLREIGIAISGPFDNQIKFIDIMEALRKNSSITKFSINTRALTSEMAMAMSEMLARNRTLHHVAVDNRHEASPAEVKTIIKGLRRNYILISLKIRYKPHDSEESRELTALLERNIILLDKAADFVISGAGVSDEKGMYALNRIYSSACIVEYVQRMTGRTREDAKEDVQAALDRARESHGYYC